VRRPGNLSRAGPSRNEPGRAGPGKRGVPAGRAPWGQAVRCRLAGAVRRAPAGRRRRVQAVGPVVRVVGPSAHGGEPFGGGAPARRIRRARGGRLVEVGLLRGGEGAGSGAGTAVEDVIGVVLQSGVVGVGASDGACARRNRMRVGGLGADLSRAIDASDAAILVQGTAGY
jgi:hypothetical protein